MLNIKDFNLDSDIYEMAIKHYGEPSQCLKAMEECGELVQALAKTLLKSFDGKMVPEANVIEELADVYIMVQQMAIVFGKEEFREAAFKKKHRLGLRIATELAAEAKEQ